MMSEYQWLLLAKLINRHYSIDEALELMKSIYPKNKGITRLINGLKDGLSVDLLVGKDKMGKQLSFYCKYLDLAKAIAVAHHYLGFRDSIRKKLSSKLSYSMLVLLASLFVLFLFTEAVLPTMLTAVMVESGEVSFVKTAFMVLNIIKDVIVVVITVVTIVYLIIKFKHLETVFWMKLHSLKMDKLLKMIVTYRFVIILNTLLGQGIDIVSCLQIIRYYQNDNMVALVGYHFNESLLAGNSFEDSLALEYLDEEFSSICMWGYKSDEFIKALGDYQEIIELKSMQKINQLAMTFQILCYTFIGAIVILAYQVLLLPLELLNGF